MKKSDLVKNGWTHCDQCGDELDVGFPAEAQGHNDILCPECAFSHQGKDLVVEVADRFLRRQATIGELRAAVKAAKGEERVWRVNKCDPSGNILTGYEEILRGTRAEVEGDFRHYNEIEEEEAVDVEEVVD